MEVVPVAMGQQYAHAHGLHTRFVAVLPGTGLEGVSSWRSRSRGAAASWPSTWQTRVGDAKVVIDRRGTHLRFGLGIYQTAEEVDRLLERMRGLQRPRQVLRAPGA